MTSKAVAPFKDEYDPSVAIIITNWNYGQFLGGCIESVLAQTVQPQEIIVVDDGSTDGSAAVLAGYAGGVQIIRKPNGGQASAFNAGFARSTSQIVMFLDADDLLRPEAVETIITWWHPGLSSLSFRLELIDVEGRSRGLYEETLRVDEGDKRKRLMARGVFAFAPTSGNAFSRTFLDDFMPLDEKRWRISADMPLIYAAALHGPNAVLQHVLGAYRTHGSNNYYREQLPDAWRLHRGMRDVVDALGLLADRQRLQGKPRGDGALELALRFAALKMRAKLQTQEGGEGDLSRHARHHLRRLLTSALPLSMRLVGAVPFAVIGFGGWRSSTCRRWIEDVRSRPAIVERVTTAMRDRSAEGLCARLAGLERFRWHGMVPFGVRQAPDFNGSLASMMAEGWSGEMSDTLHWSRGPEACLEFRLDATPHAVRLHLSLVMGPAFAAKLIAVETMIGTRRLTYDHLRDHGTIKIDLAREMIDDSAPVRLRLVCSVVPRPSFWRGALSPVLYFSIQSWQVTPLQIDTSFPLLSPGVFCSLGRILLSNPERAGWLVDASGTAWMIQSEATCRVTVAPCSDSAVLVLALAHTDASGWLRITCNDAPLFSGSVTSGAELQCALPPITSADEVGLELVFTFVAGDPTDAARLGIVTLGLIGWNEAATVPGAPVQHRCPHINIGERVDLDLDSHRSFAVGSGWDVTNGSGLHNLEVEASLAFIIPAGCLDPVVHLSIEPLLAEPRGHHHVVAVSADHHLLVSARLQGVGDLAVALPQTVVRSDGQVTLTVHSVLVPEAQGPGRPAAPMFAGIKLGAISLSADPIAADVGPAPAPHTYAGSDLAALASEAREAIRGLRPTERGALGRIRDSLATAISRADDRAIASHLAEPDFLGIVEVLAASGPRAPAEAALMAGDEALRPAEGSRLRQVLRAMLLASEPDAADPDLMTLPAPLLWSIGPLARFLAIRRGPGPSDASDREACAYDEQLLGSVLDVLRHEPVPSARYRLAVEVLAAFEVGLDRRALAASIRVQRLWARSVELHLSRTGCALAAGRPRRLSTQRIRVGLFVRDTIPGPESGLLWGIGSILDLNRFEPILIRLARSRDGIDPDGFFEAVTDLMEAPIGLCAARIRNLDLDMLLILPTLHRLDKIAAVAAHRLAPAQILLPGANGVGSCLRSMSGELQWETAEPWSASETRVRSSMALPCLDVIAIAAQQLDTVTDRVREPRRPVVAMLGRVADTLASLSLCELWIRILAEAPDSALLIDAGGAVAAGNDETALLRGRISLMCRDMDVAAERVSFLEAATPRLDGRETSVADIYLGHLDEGAPGLLSALAMQVPFVALSECVEAPLAPYAWAACLLKAGLTACSPEAYVRMAVDLVRDPALRDRRLQDMKSAVTGPAAFVEAGVGDAFNLALLRSASDAGLRPPIEPTPSIEVGASQTASSVDRLGP